MLKKLYSSKGLGLGTITLAIFAALMILAPLSAQSQTVVVSDFAVGVQASDHGCSAQYGPTKFTPFLSAGGGESGQTSDSNNYDPDCFELSMRFKDPAGNTIPTGSVPAGTPIEVKIEKDFRICAQLGDNGANNELGEKVCTQWASDVGWNPAITPAIGDGRGANGGTPFYDPDYINVSLETRNLPRNALSIYRFRLGLQVLDDHGTGQHGTIKYTEPPARAPFNNYTLKTGMATDQNAYDPDAIKLVLSEVAMNTPLCIEALPAASQPTVNQNDQALIGIDGTGTGWKDCASDRVLTNLRLHNNNGDRKEWSGTCSDTANLVDTSFQYFATVPAGTPRRVYPTSDDAWCYGDEVLVGALYYDDDATGSSDEGIRAISCRKMLPGVTLDWSNVQVFANAGCGANECNSYNNAYGSLRTARDAQGRPFAPIGMNIRPNDSHKYARGIWAAPVKEIPPQPVPCDVCDMPKPVVQTTFGSGDGEKIIYNQFSNPGTDPYILAAPSFDQSNGWWSGSAIDYPNTRWISRWANDFVDGAGPEANACFTAIEKFTLDMDSITSASLYYLVDDFLDVVLNQRVIHRSGPDWLWLNPSYVQIPIDALNKTGENILSIQACQGTNHKYTQFALNYKGVILGQGSKPAAPATCTACVPAGRNLAQPISTFPNATPSGGAAGSACNADSLHIGVSTAYSSKQIVAGMCAKTTLGFFASNDLTRIAKPTNNTGTLRCAAGSVIAEFTEYGVSCRPVAGGELALAGRGERTIAIGSGNAVNNFFSFAQNNSNKIWAPVALTYAGQAYPASVTVAEVRTAPACTEAERQPPAQDGDLMVARFGGPFSFVANQPPVFGNPIDGTEAWLDTATPAVGQKQSANPAMFLKIGASERLVYATDLPGKKEVVSIGHCARGNTSCSPWAQAYTLPASACNGTYCKFPDPVQIAANYVSRIAFAYVPEDSTGLPPFWPTRPQCDDDQDNDGDMKIDFGRDPGCESLVDNDERDTLLPPPPPPPPSTCSLTATPATIVLNIGSSKLTWNCIAGPVTISAVDNPAFNPVTRPDAQGFINVAPDKTTIFRVTSADGVVAEATVTVGGSVFDETGGDM